MGWAIGFDTRWKRDVGYGVPAQCDHPRCTAKIDRGLSYVCCDEEPYGGERGCGLYFCGDHRGWDGRCPRCENGKPPYKRPSLDVAEWIKHKLTDPSWSDWRAANQKHVDRLKAAIAALPLESTQ